MQEPIFLRLTMHDGRSILVNINQLINVLPDGMHANHSVLNVLGQERAMGVKESFDQVLAAIQKAGAKII